VDSIPDHHPEACSFKFGLLVKDIVQLMHGRVFLRLVPAAERL
jgi:hypothetical protein